MTLKKNIAIRKIALVYYIYNILIGFYWGFIYATKNNYDFPATVDCQWSEWTVAPCSETCGKGHRKKVRTKIVEENNGGICRGKDVEKEYCNLKECLGIENSKISI